MSAKVRYDENGGPVIEVTGANWVDDPKPPNADPSTWTLPAWSDPTDWSLPNFTKKTPWLLIAGIAAVGGYFLFSKPRRTRRSRQ